MQFVLSPHHQHLQQQLQNIQHQFHPQYHHQQQQNGLISQQQPPVIVPHHHAVRPFIPPIALVRTSSHNRIIQQVVRTLPQSPVLLNHHIHQQSPIKQNQQQQPHTLLNHNNQSK